MTAFTGRDDAGHVVEDLTPETLRVLLQHAARYVILQDSTRGEERHAKAVRLDEEAWRVEVHGGGGGSGGGGGGGEPTTATTAANLDAAYDILRSWAADDGWWQDAFRWEQV